MKANVLSSDAQAILLLASPLAVGRNGDGAKRFSLREWNDLARVIAASDIGRPGGLLGLGTDELRRRLGVDTSTADRIARLLGRGVDLSLEIERLTSRGIWVLTRADDSYPARWKERLRERAPVTVFGVGNASLLASADVLAIVGSRDVDETGADWTRQLAGRCAREKILVVSGAARGVDRTAMGAALEGGGSAVGVLAESLMQMLRNRELRDYLMSDSLALVSTNHPDMRFTAGVAMERNKYIYALATWSVVVSSAFEEGGTWSGALENLKTGWAPLYVRNGKQVPDGNQQLINRGGIPLRLEDLYTAGLREHLNASRLPSGLRQPLFVREGAPSASIEALPDAFDVMWPYLDGYLRVPRTEAEIARALRLEKSQVKKWLMRAVEESRVEKLKKPVRYRSARRADPNQPGLFVIE